MSYQPSPTRYDRTAFYRRCGRSGLKLPALSLGLWHNFGDADPYERSRTLVLGAFDRGITHFDLANNYGPPAGASEQIFGRILRGDLRPWRDEILVTTKAGYQMWPGPYGEWGSRKHLLSSLDQSLRRLGLDYVDIFYHHRPDPETPLEETMAALDHIVRSGKALYVGLSNYDHEQTARALAVLRGLGVPCLIHQPRFSMLDRWPEAHLLPLLEKEGVGCIPFSPLAKGLLTNRYFQGIPADSRAGHDPRFLRPEHVTDAVLVKTRKLDALAKARGQTLAQMALAWLLGRPAVTTVLIGASKPSQVEDCAGAGANLAFTTGELAAIEQILASD